VTPSSRRTSGPAHRGRTTLLLLLLSVAAIRLSGQAPDTTAHIALAHATVIDGTSSSPRANQTVLLQGEWIAAIFPTGSRVLPPGTTTIDLTGQFLIPGLIDTHVHVATDPSKEDTQVRAHRRLRNALMGGITAVRDMAGDVRSLGLLQREALLGEIPSPDLYYVALFAGPEFFADPRTHDASRGLVAGQIAWMRAITDSTDLHQAVAEARGSGATAIKLYAALSGELARRITTEAHAQGLAVWAHAALRPATPIDVVIAGVDVVSHASLTAIAMDPARRAADLKALPGQPLDLEDPGLDTLFREMVRRHTVLEPTLLVYADSPSRQRLAGEIARRAHNQGVTIVAGTDTLAGADSDTLELPNLHAELELLVRLGGLTPAEALTSATRNAATILGASASRGTVEAGKLADLVVLRHNPLSDIRNTRSITLVVKRGQLYRRCSLYQTRTRSDGSR
jgi:imidazolonepropionase-like amidohydrolase